MYTPSHFAANDVAAIESLIHDNAFGAMISVVNGSPQVTHLPFLYDPRQHVLLGHVARANPHWQALAAAPETLVIFQGPHAYVSPTWYGETGGVPTWNYVVAHVRGAASVFTDVERLHTVVATLSETYEAGFAKPWDGAYDSRKLKAIVGIEIRITHIEAKFKLSQNRPAEDRAAVIAHLDAPGTSDAQRVAQWMRRWESSPH